MALIWCEECKYGIRGQGEQKRKKKSKKGDEVEMQRGYMGHKWNRVGSRQYLCQIRGGTCDEKSEFCWEDTTQESRFYLSFSPTLINEQHIYMDMDRYEYEYGEYECGDGSVTLC